MVDLNVISIICISDHNDGGEKERESGNEEGKNTEKEVKSME